MSTSPAEVEALFGSVSRREEDCLSDRDVIIIDDDFKVLKHCQKELEYEGASVAPYTWNKLETLAKNGALFVQHLKLESEVIEDRNGRYRALLEDYRPKNSYSRELEENSRLVGIIERFPDSSQGVLWAADVLYVSLRNYGVLSLAGQKKYVFFF